VVNVDNVDNEYNVGNLFDEDNMVYLKNIN
jgi:hypothetical protein